MTNLFLKGKRIIVVGCSSGNGLGAVQRMVEAGANVVGFSRRMSEDLIKDANERGEGSFSWIKLDITQSEKAKIAVEKAIDILGGGLDALVCCSYIYWEKKCEELTREDFDTIFNTNFFGHVYINQLCFPYLKESKGTIINFGSGAGTTTKTVGSDPAHYCATKGAMHMWTKKIASEWGVYGINANIVCPMVWTPMCDAANNTPEKLAWQAQRVREHLFLPETYLSKAGAYYLISPTVAFLCSDEAKYITGQVINVDGGMVESR